MSDRRLDPAQLKARLQASLAVEPARGHLRPAVFSQLIEREPAEIGAVSTTVEIAETSGSDASSRAPMRGAKDPAGPTLRDLKDGREAREPKKRQVLHRSDAGAVLRGYRIPLQLHRRAERAKLAASAARGATLFWDEILQGAIDALPSDIREIAKGIPAPSGRAEPNPTSRVLQAAIRHDQELMLRRLRLDLEEALNRTVRLEELWAFLVERAVERHILSA